MTYIPDTPFLTVRQEQEAASKAGESFFASQKPCNTCGGHERYTSTAVCATCALCHTTCATDVRRSEATEERMNAEDDGVPRYLGQRCTACGGSEKDTKTGKCYHCHTEFMEKAQAAHEAGHTTYEGKACSECKGVRRKVRNHRCVKCSVSPREVAKVLGRFSFIGKACKVCRTTEKCTSNGACRQCQRTRRQRNVK